MWKQLQNVVTEVRSAFYFLLYNHFSMFLDNPMTKTHLRDGVCYSPPQL